MDINKKISQSCIASLVFIACELVFSLVLKAKAVPSSIVIGGEGAQSLVYFMPLAAGIVLYVLSAFTTFLTVSSFKAFAKGSIPKWFAFAGAWLLNAAVSLQTAFKISTMELFSFENNIMRIAQFVIIVFSVISCFAVRRMRISK